MKEQLNLTAVFLRVLWPYVSKLLFISKLTQKGPD